MNNEELDRARGAEAYRLWESAESRVGEENRATIAARLAREGWTPPEPVDPDVLACREWMINRSGTPGYQEEVLAGKWDRGANALGFLAGARMATERERERADIHIPVIAVELATRFRHLLHSLPLNDRVQLGVKWDLDDAFLNGVEVTLAKYRGEA